MKKPTVYEKNTLKNTTANCVLFQFFHVLPIVQFTLMKIKKKEKIQLNI